MPPYRPYQATLNSADVQLLADFDEYFQDVAETMKGLTQPTIFITCWILKATTVLRESPKLTLLDLIVDVLRQQGKVYILWNSESSLHNPIRVMDDARRLRNSARDALGDEWVDGSLKIVVAHVRHFEPTQVGRMLFQAGGGGPTTADEALVKLWLADFPNQHPRDRNVSGFSVQAMHQKTFVALGTRSGTPSLTAYCGGMDFITSKNNENGKGWHDYALRVRGDRAIGVLTNMAQRWNAELARLDDIVSIGVTATDTLDAATLWAATNDANATDTTSRRTLPSNDPAERVTEVLADYESLVDQAQSRIILLNQYVRHRDLANRLEQRLAAVPALRVTIVMPSYAEEMPGGGLDFAKLRHQFAHAPDAAARTALDPRVDEAVARVPPDQKLALELQTRSLEDLVVHPRVRIWFPERVSRNAQGRITDYRARPYVHAKVMAIDEAALTVGSANLNPRSLDGLADVELNLTFRRATSPTLPDVPELLAAAGWTAEPADETDTAVYRTGNYYFEHNLVRYKPAHLEFDKRLAKFPIGRAAIKAYFRAQRTGPAETALERVQNDVQLDLALNAAKARGLDVDQENLGPKLLLFLNDFL